MKRYFICIILFWGGNLLAQQDPQFTMSHTNQMFFNPAAMGSKNCITATGHTRFHWNGLKDAPVSWVFALDVPFSFGKTKQNMIGFGITGFGEYIGKSIDGGLKFAFNYRRCKLGPGDLAIGVDMGIISKRFNNAVWITPTGQPDPGLPEPNAAGETFDLGVGVHYSGDNFYSGISATHINAGRVTQTNFNFAPHLYFNGGGYIAVGAKKNWRINPNGIVRTDFATANFDVGVNAICFIKENHGIIFGSTYRYIDAVAFNVGYAFKYNKRDKTGMFVIQYNYDINTSRLNSFNSGSNEIVLRFCFPNKNVQFQKVFF